MFAVKQIFTIAILSFVSLSLYAKDVDKVKALEVDSSVKPGVDFFEYANGLWLKKAQIPPDKARFGVGSELQDIVDKRVKDLILAASKSKTSRGTSEQRIADYYSSFLDEKSIEKRGLSPLLADFQAIAAIQDLKKLSQYLGASLRADVDILNNTNTETTNLFGLWIAQDLDEPTRYLPFIIQGGLGMPNRNYYIDPSERMAADRESYKKYSRNMLKLWGDSESKAAQAANQIFDLELKIAKSHASLEDTEDVKKGNNHWSLKDLTTRAPGMDWVSFLVAAKLNDQNTFVVWQPDAIKAISALTASENLEVWRAYLKFHSLDHFGGMLPKKFVDERFNFKSKTLLGIPKIRARWLRGVDVTSWALGEDIGKLYTEKYFLPDEKKLVEEMVHNLISAFSKRIDKLQWMAPETKKTAQAKLKTLNVSVGYPNRWRDYSSLEVIKGDALGNYRRAEIFEYQRNLKKLGQPIDREEWVMVPQLVNAVNLPVMNAIQFPAGMLQPPFFGANQSLAMNMGGIGAVIGHEISHSFDDDGALFDDTGKMRNWWTPQDFEHFKASGEALARQYSQYKPFPDVAINGKQTLSENIADLAGLIASYDAYKLALANHPELQKDKLNTDQVFFISFAKSWREKERDAALREQIATNGHAPSKYRTYTVRNLDSWYESFKIDKEDRLYLEPIQRVHVW